VLELITWCSLIIIYRELRKRDLVPKRLKLLQILCKISQQDLVSQKTTSNFFEAKGGNFFVSYRSFFVGHSWTHFMYPHQRLTHCFKRLFLNKILAIKNLVETMVPIENTSRGLIQFVRILPFTHSC